MSEQEVIIKSENYVLDLLKKVDKYPYHNINHTFEVYERSFYLCDKEKINKENKTSILLAALFHDTGFTINYYKNEIIGAKIAREFLEKIKWPEEKIEDIEQIILATTVFSQPKNKLGKIIQDADFENFGRSDCLKKTLEVRKELRLIVGNDIPVLQWYNMTAELMQKHSFKTKTAQEEGNKKKEENLKKLNKKIEDLSSKLLCLTAF
ncbi:HD domain-containing protein [Candidatus Gracilibacteria bacterium]|nr:HD domain-containing protein [Candidatus Gracilibacteria bacterium]